MKTVAITLVLALSTTLAGCTSETPAVTAAVSAETHTRPSSSSPQREQVSRMVGMDLAEQLEPVHDEVDLDIALQTVRDQLAGKAPPLSAAQRDQVRQDFGVRLRDKREQERQRLIAKNQQLSQQFFTANAARPGVVMTASGLQYQVLRDNSGPRPTADDTVRVHYIGTHLDGSPFDNSYERDHPVEVVLNQVIAGWREGLALMPAGSKYRFWLPGKLAYGDNGKPGELEPNAALVFDIELLEIAGQPLPPAGAAAAAN